MIRLENIEKYYGEKTRRLRVLKGVDLHVKTGEMIAIMGSSGSGKSTLLNILGILDQHDGGVYHLDGQRVERLSEKRAARFRNLHMGFVFQAFNLLPFKSAMENVSLPLYYQKVGRKERNRRALEMLDSVGLADRAMYRPNELSGGQKQRVAIARALVTDPRVVLADEPTGALDSATTADIMSLFKRINDAGKTIVIVTHEQDIANACSRLIHLHDGRVVEACSSPA